MARTIPLIQVGTIQQAIRRWETALAVRLPLTAWSGRPAGRRFQIEIVGGPLTAGAESRNPCASWMARLLAAASSRSSKATHASLPRWLEECSRQ